MKKTHPLARITIRTDDGEFPLALLANAIWFDDRGTLLLVMKNDEERELTGHAAKQAWAQLRELYDGEIREGQT